MLIKKRKHARAFSKSVVKKEINHADYLNVLKTGETLSKEVIGFRSDNHVIHTTKTKKKALTSWYDKMQMIDEINKVPFGYKRCHRCIKPCGYPQGFTDYCQMFSSVQIL